MPRRSLSARTRIVGWMLLLVGAALAVSAVSSSMVLRAQVDDRTGERLRGEADKLRRFAASAREPSTGERFADSASLLTTFMRSCHAGENETFFTIVDGSADRRSPHRPPIRLYKDPVAVQMLSRPAGPGWAGSTPPSARCRPRWWPSYWARPAPGSPASASTGWSSAASPTRSPSPAPVTTRLASVEVLTVVVTFAVIASAESLFSAAAIDRTHTGPKTKYNAELFSQASATPSAVLPAPCR